MKDELLQLLLDSYDDYNFCRNGIAEALKQFATENDAQKIATWANAIQDILTPESDENFAIGFTVGAAHFLSELDLSIVRRVFLPSNVDSPIPEIKSRILCHILRDHRSTIALDFAGELLLRGIDKVVFAIFLISKYPKSNCEISWSTFSDSHIYRLVSILCEAQDYWALDALSGISANRPDLAELLKQIALKKSGIEKASLLYCVSPTELTKVFQALDEIAELSDEERCVIPIKILRNIKLDWTGREDLFVKIMKLRDINLTSSLLGGSCPPSVLNLGKLEIWDIDWCLEWMQEVHSGKDGNWFVSQLGVLFSTNLDNEIQEKFIVEYNKPDSMYRSLLLQLVLPSFNNITTDVFNEDSISFMLADLNRSSSGYTIPGQLIGNVATEKFISERILPLISGAKQPLLNNLQYVLREAGSRHGKRYIYE